MTKTMISVVAAIPDEDVHAFMQHMRNFDSSHPGCYFQINASTDLPTDEVEKILSDIDPAFPFRTTIPLKKR